MRINSFTVIPFWRIVPLLYHPGISVQPVIYAACIAQNLYRAVFPLFYGIWTPPKALPALSEPSLAVLEASLSGRIGPARERSSIKAEVRSRRLYSAIASGILFGLHGSATFFPLPQTVFP